MSIIVILSDAELAAFDNAGNMPMGETPSQRSIPRYVPGTYVRNAIMMGTSGTL